MILDDINPTSSERFHNEPGAIDALARKLDTRLPKGYREYISRFGEGVLGTYIRIFPPHRILEGELSVTEWRNRVDEYWFWDEGADVLTKAKALESIIVADTLDGDELIFHPSEPDRLYVLPRHDEIIFVAGEGLLAAIAWLCTSGTLTDPIDDLSFEPFDGLTEEQE